MKILKILYSLTSGGAERLVLDLSNKLSQDNEMHLLVLLNDEIGDNGFYKSLLSDKVHYHCAYEDPGPSLKKFYRINKIIKEIDPDIVHFHGKGIIYYFLPSIFLNRKPKYVETIHNKAEVIFKGWYSSIALTFFRMGLINMVTISDENKLGVENLTNIKNSTLIYNGRSKPTSSIKIKKIQNEISELKNDKNDLVFIHVGRCAYEKNQKMLVEAFNDLNDKGVGYILLIFGLGFDSEMGEEVKGLANPNIHFMGTTLNIIDYFLCSDAFCLSSRYEGMPITLIEAFGSECVPVCTPTSGASDLIIDGENGFISDDFSKNSYIGTLERYIKNRNDFDKTILRHTYNEMFSMEKCTNSHIVLYKSILKRNN